MNIKAQSTAAGPGAANRTRRASLGAETVAIGQAGSYRTLAGKEVVIAPALAACIAGTRILLPEDLARHRAEELGRAARTPVADAVIEVANETTLEGACALARAHRGSRLGVLNFASARNPGGGFLGGSQAQEESLARSSGLYASLTSRMDFYEFHRDQPDLLYSHRMILSPDCPVFRDDDGTLLGEPYPVTFITAAAPNRGAIEDRQPHALGRIPATLRERAEFVLVAAAIAGCEHLVLGAWGCGVFRNDPVLVAGIFADLLAPGTPWRRRFARIRFSVFDRTPGQEIYAAFRDRFEAAATSS